MRGTINYHSINILNNKYVRFFLAKGDYSQSFTVKVE
jgi:hypothetical protein